MEILRIKDAPEKSIIYYNGTTIFIADLPAGLKKMMTDGLQKLTGVKKVIPVFSDIGKTVSVIIELPEKLSLLEQLNGLDENAKTQFVIALNLLLWHLSPRWLSGNPGAFGAPCRCTDCGATARPMETNCKNSSCPSHENYRLVNGE